MGNFNGGHEWDFNGSLCSSVIMSNLLSLYLYHKRRKLFIQAIVWHSPIFDTLPKAAFFIFNQRLSIRVFGRRDTGGGMDRCADR